MTIPDVSYEVFVEWDMTDWSAAPGWADPDHDISADVQIVGWVRGKEAEAGNAPAGTFEVKMIPGLHAKYSPVNAASPLYGKLLPWRIIRVRGKRDDGDWKSIFFGYISKYRIALNDPDPAKSEVSLYCTDGADLLARQLVTQDYPNRTEQTEGEAVNAILDSAGWGTRRSIDTGDSVKYPAVSEA